MTGADTIDSYRKHARAAISNWTKRAGRAGGGRFSLRDEALKHMRQSGSKRVLDLGCGPGNDLVVFARAGCEVVGVDAVPEFLRHARKRVKSKHVRIVKALIEEIGPGVPVGIGKKSYDLIWANASLIHFPKRDLPGILRRLKTLCNPAGMFAATFFHGKGEGVYAGSFVPGRFFARYLKEEIVELFERAGWPVGQARVVNGEHRAGRWIDLLAVRAAYTYLTTGDFCRTMGAMKGDE